MATRPINPELLEAVKRQAPTIGLSPQDLLGIYSYETAGSLNPWQRGPTTKWGTHRGLIQWGEPQARKYGVSATTPVDQQVAASIKYLRDRGFKPGMGLLQAYAAVNAGGIGPKYYQARDAAAGGAPGTVADKVNKQMGPHLAKAERLLGGGIGPPTMTASAPKVMPADVAGAPTAVASAAPTPGAVGTPNAVPTLPADPTQGVLAATPDPFKAIADAAEKRQAQQQAAFVASQAAAQPPQIQPAPAPPPDPMQAQQASVDYAGLLLPRIKRGLLADDYSSGLLGAG